MSVTGKRGVGINVSTSFPRYQDEYTLGLNPLPSGSLGLIFAPKFEALKPGQPGYDNPLVRRAAPPSPVL